MKKFYTQQNVRRFALALTAMAFATVTQAQSYIQSSCDYAPLTTDGTVICLGDDMVSGAIPLGFTFNFYDVPFTDCYVSSNGYLSFSAGLGSACCSGVVLPSSLYPYSIFFGQEDLDPNTCVDGTISYYTTGAPGSQIFVLSFTDVPHYPGPAGTYPVTTQVQLFEGSNEIKIVTTEYNEDVATDIIGSTMGLNESGTNADVVPGRNSAEWSAFDECILFAPSGIPTEGCMDPTAINYDPGADIDDGSCFYGYTYATCDYDPKPTEGTSVCLGDDQVSGAIPIGFSFNFYGNTYTECYIGSNGFVTFNSGLGTGCCTGQVLPNSSFLNTIFIGQEDLNPNLCGFGDINYYTTGVIGDNTFVVNFVNIPHYTSPADATYFPVSMQLQLYEATGEIKVLETSWLTDGGPSTIGLNYNGTFADPAPGKNSTVWDAIEECHSWTPSYTPIPVCEIPSGLFVDGITDNDAVLHWTAVDGADQYRVTITNTATGLTKTKGFYVNEVAIVDKLTPLTTYGFRVKTVCYDDLGEISDPSEWVYWTTLGRFGDVENTTVSLFPNPNNGAFTLSLNGLQESTFDLNVFDAVGHLVYSKQVTANSDSYSETIALDVPAGMYQVSIKNSLGVMSYPIVIQK